MNPLLSEKYFILLSVPFLMVAVVISWHSTRTLQKKWRIAITLFRLMGIAGVLLLLLNFGYMKELVQDSRSSWTIMIDNSKSMTVADVEGNSRYKAAVAIIEDVLKRSTDKNRINIYTFSDSIKRIKPEDLSSLIPDGGDTRLVESGVNLLIQEKTRGSRTLGVLLLSDGRQPVPRPPDPFALRAAARGIPIFPVILGGKVPSRDLSLSLSRKRLVSFKDQPVRVQGILVNDRMGPLMADVVLRDADGNVLETKNLLLEDSDQLPFDFKLSQSDPGYYEYIIETPLRNGESDRANNRIGFSLFVLSKSLNVMLLEGEPYWDTKFLSHLLRAQSNISMTAVFRVATDKYFKVATDQNMTTFGTDVFPETIEELQNYDIVVIGRGSEYFIDENRSGLLMDFVRNQGGCLFFVRGKPYEGNDSLLQELEPVSWGAPVLSDFTLSPGLVGEQVGLFGGLLPDRRSQLWGKLPILTRANECTQLKSFASVLAEGIPVRSGDPSFPLIISRRYGRGMVLLINADGLWKWGFSPDDDDINDFYKNLWIQLFQWAVSFAEFNPGSNFMIRTDYSSVRVREPLRVRVQARTHMETDFVVRIYQGDRPVQTMTLSEDTLVRDAWSGLVTLPESGIYRLAVETIEGTDMGAQTTVQILPPPTEEDNLSADDIFLKDLAKKSGGRIVTRDEPAELITQLELNQMVVKKGDMIWKPLWDNPWVLIGLFLFFSLEWYLRRRQGLH